MKKYILLVSIVSIATITHANHSIAQELTSINHNEQSPRGLINDFFCFYDNGFFDPACWIS